MRRKTMVIGAASVAAVIVIAGAVWAVTNQNARTDGGDGERPSAVATITPTPSAGGLSETPEPAAPGEDDHGHENTEYGGEIIVDEESLEFAVTFVDEYGRYDSEESDEDRRARLAKFNVAPDVLDQPLPVQLTFEDLNYSEAVVTSAPTGELDGGVNGMEGDDGTVPYWVGGSWVTTMSVGGTEQIGGGRLAWNVTITTGPEKRVVAVALLPGI